MRALPAGLEFVREQQVFEIGPTSAASRYQAREFGAGTSVVRHLDVWRNYPITRTTMLANYLKIALRNLLLHPGYLYQYRRAHAGADMLLAHLSVRSPVRGALLIR